MPDMTIEEMKTFFKELMKGAKPLSLMVSRATEEQALLESEEYFKGKIDDISTLLPLSVYYILRKLPKEEHILFIQKNIQYVKEHMDDIFLVNMEAPKELAYYFSYETLVSIYELDTELFEKIIEGQVENIFQGFSQENYFSYFEKFKSYIVKMKANRLFHILAKHNRFLLDILDIKQLKNTIELQAKCNEEFIAYFIENYSEKINRFTPRELLTFISYIKNIDAYKKYVLENRKKLEIALKNIKEEDLDEYLCEYFDSQQQEVLFSNFLEQIAKKHDIRKIISNISSQVIFEMYKSNKEIFAKMTLDDWIKLCGKKHEFNQEYQNILDDYKVDNMTELFDVEFYTSVWDYHDSAALQYIESKYRNCLDGNKLTPIEQISSIFSEEYMNNLEYLKKHLENQSITKNSKIYEENLAELIMYLKSHNIVLTFDNTNFNEVNKFFHQIIKGLSLSTLFEIKTIEDIAIINRLGKKEFKMSDFTVEQIEKYNVKQHRKLCESFEDNKYYKAQYKNLVLKLLLLVGFNNTKRILEIDSDISTLEHLVGNVDVKHVTFDASNNPILNHKILNLLFKNEERLKTFLSNKKDDVYTYFPRIFNEWELIKLNGKDESLKMIIDFLKTDDITLPPNYYRLDGLFKYIGCANNTVEETLKLHDEMLKRTESTIPKISGQVGEYTYEIIGLHDMEGLTVGNKTNCCFTVLGNGYSCLKHATMSKNGRVLAVKKNGELLAHSWVWRNGNLLCIDNIEISKSIHQVTFLEVYIDLANKMIEKSFETEGIKECIKNVTIGYTNFDKTIVGIQNYPCYVFEKCDLSEKDFGKQIGNNRRMMKELPHPIENVGYSDATNVQYLIQGTGNFELYQSNYLYREEREETLSYDSHSYYSEEYINKMNAIVNALRYIRFTQEGHVNSYKPIDVRSYQTVICNSDWYLLVAFDREPESFINSTDKRAFEELESTQGEINKRDLKIAI